MDVSKESLTFALEKIVTNSYEEIYDCFPEHGRLADDELCTKGGNGYVHQRTRDQPDRHLIFWQLW